MTSLFSVSCFDVLLSNLSMLTDCSNVFLGDDFCRQLDNNQFFYAEIPKSYVNFSTLVKFLVACGGPNAVVPEILKPDLIGPGVNILSAWTGDASPSGLKIDTRRTEYNILSGWYTQKWRKRSAVCSYPMVKETHVLKLR
ncbi:hypothetical protein Droror1_Dr00002592 [Drosera rotundifolia]